MTQLSDRPVSALELHLEIQKRKKEVDEAITELESMITDKLVAEDAYEKAKAKARINSVALSPGFREKDHDAYVSQHTDKERFEAALKKELLRFQYKVLEARKSQLSATQTDAKVVMQEMQFVQTGPSEF